MIQFILLTCNLLINKISFKIVIIIGFIIGNKYYSILYI